MFSHTCKNCYKTQTCALIALKFGTQKGSPKANSSIKFGANPMNGAGVMTQTSVQSLLLSQTNTFSSDIRGEQLLIKNEIYRMKFSMTSSNKASLLEGATTSLKRSIELASEKGASNWLSVLPLQEYKFSLHKTAFHDAVTLRYGWDPARLPQHCTCGTKFTVELPLLVPRVVSLLSVTTRSVT